MSKWLLALMVSQAVVTKAFAADFWGSLEELCRDYTTATHSVCNRANGIQAITRELERIAASYPIGSKAQTPSDCSVTFLENAMQEIASKSANPELSSVTPGDVVFLESDDLQITKRVNGIMKGKSYSAVVSLRASDCSLLGSYAYLR